MKRDGETDEWVINVKYSKEDREKYSDAIDRMQEGLDSMIDLYNEAEDDKDLIQYEEDVISAIKRAKETFGSDFIDQKINTIVKEVLSLMQGGQTPGLSPDKDK
ncbi:protein mistic [Fictibacillus sp. NPDC058756]|uniref:protein mistic n=1 Tax=Fictibacillus sp. NPDC058756 TaxID=3346625 RepID=UPI0036CB4F9D